MTNSLDAKESELLWACETRIERGLTEAAEALRVIRDGKLWRVTHETWEAYCRQRWDKSVRRINQIIAAGDVAGTICSPINEGQARELAKLSPEARQEAMRAVSADGKPTAGRIRELIAKAEAGLSARKINELPPQEQVEVIRHNEQRARESARQVGGTGFAQRKEQALRLLRRVVKLVEGFGADGDGAIEQLDMAKTMIEGLEE